MPEIPTNNFEHILDGLTPENFLDKVKIIVGEIEKLHPDIQKDKSEVTEKNKQIIQSLEPLFKNTDFKNCWDLFHAAKISAAIKDFEELMNKFDFQDEMGLNQFFSIIDNLLIQALLKVDSFNVNVGRDKKVKVTEEDMKYLGVLSIEHVGGRIELNEEESIKKYKILATEAFIKETRLVFIQAFKEQIGINTKVEESLDKGGYIYTIMRTNFKSFGDLAMSNRLRDYESTFEALKSTNLIPGMCPAGRFIEGTNVRIVNKIMEIVLDNLPSKLWYNPQ